MKKVSLIITVLNESSSIDSLLESIASQTTIPNEVIIIDGGSTDETLQKIETFSKNNKKLKLKFGIQKGNRSIGRNHAIKLAKHELIAITDAGCTLKKDWLEELTKQYESSKAPVVAGYYAAKTTTDFQKAVVPYALVMPDKVDPEKFLPATRSMLIEKELFQNMGGFDENLSDNEDYAFAKKLQANNIAISFAKKAIAYWIPRKTLKEFYTMIFRFARGDVFAGIVRPKVLLIFLRYIIFLLFSDLSILLLLLYSFWAIQKNKKYVGNGWKYLPLLQIVSDIAVMHGSIKGWLKKLN